jgi:menaquinone-dependent protoporphyrinogen IX oxidase
LLSSNPAAIHLLSPLDYEKTKEANAEFRRELCEKVFHPERMIRLAGDMPLWDYLEYY